MGLKGNTEAFYKRALKRVKSSLVCSGNTNYSI